MSARRPCALLRSNAGSWVTMEKLAELHGWPSPPRRRGTSGLKMGVVFQPRTRFRALTGHTEYTTIRPVVALICVNRNREMLTMLEQYAAATAALMTFSEDDLMSEAARRLARTMTLPSSAGELDEDQLQSLAIPKGISAVVRRIARRTSSELHAMVCGDTDEDQEDRRTIRDAFHLGDDAFASALVAVGIGYCGLSPALSVVIAVILVKRIGRPAMQELCEAWGKSLET
jgi:hypothetical protein